VAGTSLILSQVFDVTNLDQIRAVLPGKKSLQDISSLINFCDVKLDASCKRYWLD